MTDRYTLHHGNNLDILPTIPDNSIDSIVTDPPYELGFMGKKWDASGIAYSVDLWAECLRVLKPGGHLLAFGGTRTYHRMTVAIEDAGFEIRDSIHWLYGSGFPKSLDVSKAIDKVNGEPDRLLKFTAWMRTTGLTSRQIDEITDTNMGGHYLTAKSQPAIPTAAMWQVLRPHCGEVPDWVDALVARIEAEREVIGTSTNSIAGGTGKHAGENDAYGFAGEFNITAPATDAAKQWEGWGTALKPAHEPIVLARKPLAGTVAANVLEHGTGALNIDACRIDMGDEYDPTKVQRQQHSNGTIDGAFGASALIGKEIATYKPGGRWPANIIIDDWIADTEDDWPRYFYCAKPSKAERNAGLQQLPKGLPVGGADKWTEQDRRRGEGVTRTPTPNFHPTVKPLALMRHLIRLITPPAGIVLDPFAGSGTTLAAAIIEGHHPIGIELTDDYLPIIHGRCQHATTQHNNQPQPEPTLFDNHDN